MDLDHDRQLTRSRHEAQIRENNHLATAMDPLSKDELLTHHFGGRHGDVEASGDDLPLRQSAGKSFRTLPN